MLKKYLLIFILLLPIVSNSQNGFEFDTSKSKIKIPFQLINNLIIINIELNGVKLNFLLDTGVENTVLFSLEETDTVAFEKVEKVKIRGLGVGNSIDALLSKDNFIRIKDFVDKKHAVYIVLDQDVNFSSLLGIPVHGIIGYEFFKKYLVEVNYQNKKIVVYKTGFELSKKELNKYSQIPITLELEKPYILTKVSLNNSELETKLLIDTGSSDALWLFENKKSIVCPKLNFEDFLGRGLSGDIYGKRSRIEKIQLGEHEIKSPTCAFPEVSSIENLNFVKNRNGSIGSEILKRFKIIFDYKNQLIYLKKNNLFNELFNYNMSGIEVQHTGKQLLKEEIELKTTTKNAEISFIDNTRRFKYEFVLKPLFEITNIRKDSPAEKSGLKKGDVLSKINGRYGFNFSLQDINELFTSEEGKWIIIEVERASKILSFRFQLKKML